MIKGNLGKRKQYYTDDIPDKSVSIKKIADDVWLKIKEEHNTDTANQLKNKVDKVDGKGLSANDFTDDEKAKLADLENYDDTELKQKTEANAADIQSLSAEADKLSDELNEKADKIKTCFLINKAQRNNYIRLDWQVNFVTNDPELNYFYTNWDFEKMPAIINEKYAMCVRSGSNGAKQDALIKERMCNIYFYLSEYIELDDQIQYELYLTSYIPSGKNKDDYPLLGTWYWDNVDETGIPINVRFVWNEDIKYLDNIDNNVILDVINEMSDINKYIDKAEKRITALEGYYGECDILAQEILNGEV